MNSIYKIIFICFFSILTSCKNKTDIIVTGQVTDEAGNPISNAEVRVSCWYNHDIYDTSLDKNTTKTDNKGNFQVTFEKGYNVYIAVKSKDYEPMTASRDLAESEINIPIKLRKSKTNPTIIALTTTDLVEIETTEKSPYLRIRIQGLDNNNLDFNNIKTFGFDFSTLTTNTDVTQCDFWFKIEKKEGQPKILQTNKNGGLIPILDSEIKSSLLYEKNVAPTNGYKSEYKLNGNEAGFFVLCKDGKTYAKIILDKSLIDISSPDGQGSFYKEFGQRFRYLYQPNGTADLSNPYTDIDLESL